MHLRPVAIFAVLALTACGKEEPPKPTGPDYSKMASILEVEKVVPASLKISYQNLFSCRYETATKDGEPGPELNAKYAVDVLEAVKKDPAAGDKCLNALRAEPEKK